jgi:two-component system, NarL family, sensor histidine kinase DegS
MGPGSAAGMPQPGPGGYSGGAVSGLRSARDIGSIRAEIEEDIRRIEHENGEIDMLMEQVLIEIERHEARRAKVEERLSTLEAESGTAAGDVSETRSNLLTLTRRAMLFEAQRQVLEGKQRVMARFLQRLVEIDTSLASMTALPYRDAPVGVPGPRPPVPAPGAPGLAMSLATGAGSAPTPQASPPAVQQMRNQEDLRRDIVRQLHDGPAQSLANIALQAEIVERLVRRGDERGQSELESLRQMVQQALDATKAFIFEVRPMVLDDLGLVPTLRRAVIDRSRRSGIGVDFDSHGIERRLSPDLESVLFRTIDEAMGGYLALRPPSVVVRLDWSDAELLATVEGTWPRATPDPGSGVAGAAGPRAGETPPVLLAMMAELRSEERQAQAAARSLPPERIAEMEQRVAVLGMTLTLRDVGQILELAVPIPRPA